MKKSIRLGCEFIAHRRNYRWRPLRCPRTLLLRPPLHQLEGGGVCAEKDEAVVSFESSVLS